MTATARLTPDLVEDRPIAPIRGDLSLLDHLRGAARNARCLSYVDLYGACAVLSARPQIAAQSASEVLMRCLSQALGRRPVLLREGEGETTFDEKWLLSLARSLKTDDTSSAAFLLHSRVPAHARRNVVFLMRNVIRAFDAV